MRSASVPAVGALSAGVGLAAILTLSLASATVAGDYADLEGQVAELEGRQRVLHEWQQRQRDNIAAMRAEVERAKQEHRAPDPSKLHALATATGARSEAYREAPPSIQRRIDQVEHDQARNAGDVLRHLISFMGGRRLLFRQHYEVEIERSQRLLALLDADERAIAAELATTRNHLDKERAKTGEREDQEAEPGERPSFTDAHRERIETALAALERQVDALQESLVPLRDIRREARTVIEQAAQVHKQNFQLRDRFFDAAAYYKTSCKRLPDVRLQILAHATSAVRQAKQAQATYERARSSVDTCTSTESARAAVRDLTAAASQKERARKEEAEVEKGMDLLARLLADVPRLRSTRAELRGLNDQFTASVRDAHRIPDHLDQIREAWRARHWKFRSQQRALIGQIDRVLGGLEAEGMTLSQQRLAAIRARAADLEVRAPTFRLDYSGTADALSNLQLSTQVMEVIDLISPCEGVELPEGAAQQAGSEVYLAFLDAYEQTAQMAQECLASLEPHGTTADAERRRRLEFIHKHTQGDAGSRHTDYHSLAAQQRRAEEARRRAEEARRRAEEERRAEERRRARERERAEQGVGRDRDLPERIGGGFLEGLRERGDPPPDAGSAGREQRERAARRSQERAARERERRAASQREQARRRLRSLEGAISSAEENLRCLEEGVRRYPHMDLDCRGHFMIGARARHIRDLRARLVELRRERAQLGSLPASSLGR